MDIITYLDNKLEVFEKNMGIFVRCDNLEEVETSTKKIKVKNLNIKIEPGRYYFENIKGFLSVQYQNNLKGDGLYETLCLVDKFYEPYPKSYITIEEVKKIIKNLFDKFK